MIGRDELRNFQQMWTWLSGYPAHDREYYINHVVKLDKAWVNSCPLCNNSTERDCDGCKMLWESKSGNLCTDPESPVFKWKHTDRVWSDERTSYASRAAVLAMKLGYELDRQSGHGTLRDAA